MPLTLDANPRSMFTRYLPDTLSDDDAPLNAAIVAYNAAMTRAIYADVFTDEIHLRYVDDNRMCPARYIYV